ncbi:MAG: Mrp/NBP35 family ATP-binding protein [Armatimonadetes bacterium]|nr:Mrp/NBP35 family ATP-binding protein [Armatimonadota bacterium]
MPKVTEQHVLDALRKVIDPDLHRDIVSLKFVKDVKISDGAVAFIVELTTPACPVKEQLQQQCRDVVMALDGVQEVNVEMTARVRKSMSAADIIPDVRNVIAVASGKGGVGKSTVAVNLAVALSQTGARVGLMDADVYGPTVPLLMGCGDEKPLTESGKLIPLERHGIKLMSLGFLLEKGQAVLWRGPLVAGTVKQLLADVLWGELDYLVVDLPPGTGDAPMTLAQLVPLTGVVIVATPHDVAANIAGKSVALFTRLNTPILGVVENMSGFLCPHCGEETRIFAGLSGEELARQYEVPFLGSIPLDPAISASGDRGIPSVLALPDSLQAERFRRIAGAVAAEVSKAALMDKELTGTAAGGEERPGTDPESG